VDASDQQFMRAVQILAAPADAQVGHYPAFVSVGNELTLDFRDSFRLFLAAATNLSDEQARAITALDSYLALLSSSEAGRYWADRDAVRNDARWNQVRAQAAAVLDAFGWAHEVPERNDNLYIEGLGIGR
jgi:hypothetical protein